MATLKDTLEDLKHQRDAKLHEAQQFDAAIKQLEHLIMVVEPGSEFSMTRQAQDYSGLGIREAAKRWLLEQGNTPQDTSTITKTLLQRGVTTKSKKFTATVYTVLAESPEFKRTKDKKWVLKEEREG